MKKILLLSLLGLFTVLSSAHRPIMRSEVRQTDTTVAKKVDMAEVNRNFKKMAKTIEEVWPKYPGGQEAMDNFIIKNITYPQAAIYIKAEGTVIVSATIDSLGFITKVRILKSVEPNLDFVAKRVVKQMPAFSPGYAIREYKGVVRREARSYMIPIPITFALDK